MTYLPSSSSSITCHRLLQALVLVAEIHGREVRKTGNSFWQKCISVITDGLRMPNTTMLRLPQPRRWSDVQHPHDKSHSINSSSRHALKALRNYHSHSFLQCWEWSNRTRCYRTISSLP